EPAVVGWSRQRLERGGLRGRVMREAKEPEELGQPWPERQLSQALDDLGTDLGLDRAKALERQPRALRVPLELLGEFVERALLVEDFVELVPARGQLGVVVEHARPIE